MAEHEDTPIDAASGSSEAPPTALAGSRVRALASSEDAVSSNAAATEDDDLFADWSAEEIASLELGLDGLAFGDATLDAASVAEGPEGAPRDPDSFDTDPTPRVRTRLVDYQRLLGQAHVALLDVELPGGPGSLFERIESSARLPAGGLVESGQHVAAPSPVASLEDARERRSGSMRQAIVPLLAVAAGVALILMLAQGQQGPANSQDDVARRADKALPASANEADGDAKVMGDAEQAEAVNDLVATRTDETPAPAASAFAKDQAAAAEPMMEEQELAGQAERGAASATSVPAKPNAKPSSGGAGPGYGEAGRKKEAKPSDGAVESSKSASEDKNDQWSELDSVHALRRKGRCGLAIDQYEAIIASNPVNLVRARAEAGLALCLESTGRASDAKTHFSLAKQLDPSIGTFIDRERDKMPMNDEKSPSKAKKADALEDLP